MEFPTQYEDLAPVCAELRSEFLFFFYNNCLNFRAIIGLFFPSIRAQIDKILTYAEINFYRQTVNFLY